MQIIENYDRNEWLSVSEVHQSGKIVDKDGKPYSYHWIRNLIYRQANGGEVYFTRPDGKAAIIKVPFMVNRYQFKVHKSAVETYEPYETYQTYITDDMEDEDRRTIARRLNEGETPRKLAMEYALPESVIYRLKQKRRGS